MATVKPQVVLARQVRAMQTLLKQVDNIGSKLEAQIIEVNKAIDDLSAAPATTTAAKSAPAAKAKAKKTSDKKAVADKSKAGAQEKRAKVVKEVAAKSSSGRVIEGEVKRLKKSKRPATAE